MTDDPYYFEIGGVEIVIEDDQWLSISDLKISLEKTLKHIEKICSPRAGGDLNPDDTKDSRFRGKDSLENCSILLTNNTHIQQMNKDFRQKDKPTNVLSFPSTEPDYLGDIALSYETLQKEASEQGKEFYHHFIHLVIHGILHLVGHDHEDDIEAETMESLEIKILADMGIENPYN